MVTAYKTSTTSETFPDDPFNMELYTLSNGMKLFLSVNKEEPRVFTNIAFRAGSKYDPKDTTGLAHYMEHMLFKGTNKIGAMDWEKEKVLLEEIAELYETYRQTTATAERAEIYAKIDKLSYQAAKMVAPNEYDKLVGSLGAKQTNAYTWVEQTVYVNDIPSNELERWMMLEATRFNTLALRLFHTELETVYEEFNISQDSDVRQVGQALRKALFPNHPYGTQTTLGKPEHLRNPSMKNILQFFETYYVANNMALVLAGDFDPEIVVKLAEKYFGQHPTNELPSFSFEKQPEISAPEKIEVVSKESGYVELAWRFGSSQTDDPFMMSIISNLLYNDQAGLLDINLNQTQKVLAAETWEWYYEDYSAFGLYGKPREGQTLEEVEALLLEEIEKLKRGEFEEWLLEAIVKDLKVTETKSFENNAPRVALMTNLYVLNVDWTRFQARFNFFENKSKADIVKYANTHLNGNHVVLYKRQGEKEKVVKVEKPPITPVELNREALSPYGKEFLQYPAPPLTAVFADFEQNLHEQKLSNGVVLNYVKNENNGLFRLDYIFEMGKFASLDLSIALDYLTYAGTDKYTAAEIKQEFFRLGLSFDGYCYNEKSYLTLKGLDESLIEGVTLFEHLLQNMQPTQEIVDNIVADILVQRENDKQDRSVVLRDALSSYAKYGKNSPFTYRHSTQELKALKAETLTDIITSLNSFEHSLYYHGPQSLDKISATLGKLHHAPSTFKPCLENRSFTALATEPVVYFLDFPIVQADIMMISRGTPHFNLEEFIMRELYNEYFGYGLSSIVFQEIREAKALAYSTYVYYGSPATKDRSHYLSGYVGTQPDKIKDAIPALLNIIENIPLVDSQIKQAADAICRRIESERTPSSKLYWEYRSLKDKGYDYDLSKEVYAQMQQVDTEKLQEFHKKFVSGRHFSFLVLGNKEQVDLDYLATFGKVKELTMEEIFGY